MILDCQLYLFMEWIYLKQQQGINMKKGALRFQVNAHEPQNAVAVAVKTGLPLKSSTTRRKQPAHRMTTACAGAATVPALRKNTQTDLYEVRKLKVKNGLYTFGYTKNLIFNKI